jgi:hypothetical protein
MYIYFRGRELVWILSFEYISSTAYG